MHLVELVVTLILMNTLAHSHFWSVNMSSIMLTSGVLRCMLHSDYFEMTVTYRIFIIDLSLGYMHLGMVCPKYPGCHVKILFGL